ncbi:glycosyltransferase [Methanospirillum lacunae]|nr:glycosyltransferase [Methanospirillum lacunae]
MNSIQICLVMFGGPFDTICHRIEQRIRIFQHISTKFYLLIDKMPNTCKNLLSCSIIDLNVNYPNNTIHIISTKNRFFLYMLYLLSLLKMVKSLFKYKSVDIIIFSSGIPFILPLIIQSRILRKKVIVMAGGSIFYSSLMDIKKNLFYLKILRFFELLCYYSVTTIAVESEKSERNLNLYKFKNKVKIFGSFVYIDTDKFSPSIAYENRKFIVGFIGGFFNNKGILNFVRSIDYLSSSSNNISYLIIGDGPIKESVKATINSQNSFNRIHLISWVSHNDIPSFLNEMRLLVVPSYSEGIPAIILEAMSCGTPVLSTSVGGISDIIKDGKNGFILESNTPECIAKKIEIAMNYYNIQKISKNARDVIKKEYSYKEIIQRYDIIINKNG